MSETRSKFLTPPTCNKSSILLLYITPKIVLITKEEDHQGRLELDIKVLACSAK